MGIVVAHGVGAWAWLAVPLTGYVIVTAALAVTGRSTNREAVIHFMERVSDSLRRLTGFPGWAMAGVLSSLVMLLIVVVGFYWDVAWHIDLGRDVVLFTPFHVMILVGLGGLVYAGVVAILFATIDDARVGFDLWGLRVPYSAVLLLALGTGAVIGFPLDELWHRTYGIDVTLWSPTHLQLVGGGSAATIAALLMCAEGLPSARPNRLGRAIVVLTAGTVLVGMSTFQGEFDFGVPQFQLLYQPLLVMAATGFALVLARLALGPWGALEVALVALALRGLLALTVAGALGHTVPRFPLYVGSALLVETAAWRLGTARRLRLGIAAGLAVGTVGLLTEGGWALATGWWHTAPAPLVVGALVLGPVAAIAAAVLGAGLSRAFLPRAAPLPAAALVGAGVALLAVLAYPSPRLVGDAEATIRLDVAGAMADVEVQVHPADAARNATAFVLAYWQGGGSGTTPLDEVAPGVYRSAEPVPVTGSWKTMVSLQRGAQVMAAPIYLPADPEIGASAVPAVPERREAFVRNTEVLLREATDGPAMTAVLAYTGLAALVALWVALMAVTALRVRPDEPMKPVVPETVAVGAGPPSVTSGALPR
ncbi:MAG: hypothetical protein ACR2KP_07905 [Egibacteraceae bacterium]